MPRIIIKELQKSLNISDSELKTVKGSGLGAQGRSFQGAGFQGSSFQGTNYQGTSLQGMALQGTSLQGISLWKENYQFSFSRSSNDDDE